jgi:glycosyltransferase involved in cell wall biosynthesis
MSSVEGTSSEAGKAYHHPRMIFCLPVFNEERYIGAMLESIRKQTQEDFLTVISDNASEDSTGDVCRDICARDARFQYVRQRRNIGSFANGEYLLSNTRSPYVAFAGGHDILDARFLEKHLHVMESRPDCVLSCSATRWIDERGETLKLSRNKRLCRLPKPSPLRYALTALVLRDCTEMSHMLRRASLEEALTGVGAFAGNDVVVLSRLAASGTILSAEECLYERREFGGRTQSYMERITGMRNVACDNSFMLRILLGDLRQLCGQKVVYQCCFPFFMLALAMRYRVYSPIRGRIQEKVNG